MTLILVVVGVFLVELYIFYAPLYYLCYKWTSVYKIFGDTITAAILALSATVLSGISLPFFVDLFFCIIKTLRSS
jgi:hypothetical protein